MALLVRSWNVFHGNTLPTRREARLREIVRLAVADDPDVVCLQEVPVWALGKLDDWSAMTSFASVAARPTLGPLPSTAEIGRLVTQLHHGVLRSGFAGQGNAILVSPRLRPLDRHTLVLNPRGFRRRQGEWLALPLVARLAWAKERRVCQALRLDTRGDGTLLVANLHATSFPADRRLADAELLRAAVFLDALARPDELCILAGDFNVKADGSWTMRDLTAPEWGFAGPGPWVDHVLARSAPTSGTERWPDERRRRDGLLLSDHAPVEARIG